VIVAQLGILEVMRPEIGTAYKIAGILGAI